MSNATVESDAMFLERITIERELDKKWEYSSDMVFSNIDRLLSLAVSAADERKRGDDLAVQLAWANDLIHTKDVQLAAMREALKPRLNAKAVKMLREEMEAEYAVGSADIATAVMLLIDWHESARAALQTGKEST